VNSFLFFFAQSIGFLWQAVKRPFRQWTKPADNTLVLSTILAVTRSKSELVLENALLRQQLIVLRRQIKRPKPSWRDRTLIILLASKLRFWKQALVIVQPDTVLRDATARHRDLFRRVWRRKSKPKKKPGRPPLADQVVALIKQMARHLPMAEKTAPGARNAFGVNGHPPGAGRPRGALAEIHPRGS
jgi:hypothetical protein